MNRKNGMDIKFQIEMLETEVPGIYYSDPIPIPKFEVDAEKVFCPYCSLKEFRNHLKTETHIKEFCKFHLLPRLSDKMVLTTQSTF